MNLDYTNQVVSATREIIEMLGFPVTARWLQGGYTGRHISIVAVESPSNPTTLIGTSGQTLQAIEHIVRAMAFQKFAKKIRSEDFFVLDINSYRHQQTGRVIELACQTAQRVAASGISESLTPMLPYERRIVHMELAAYTTIKTESVGNEPHRRVVVKPVAR